MSLLEMNPDELLLPDIDQKYFEQAAKTIKPSVSKEELQ
jgi:hypothetical protein